MSSAISFNLDQSKNLSSGNELSKSDKADDAFSLVQMCRAQLVALRT